MIDFITIATRPSSRKGVIEIYPKFIIKKSSDLMIRGGDFYAVWLEEFGRWSTDEQDALQLIDNALDIYAEENKEKYEDQRIKVLHLWDADTGMIDKWHKYCQKQMRDNFHTLDEKLIFSNSKMLKRDYASKQLPYPLEKCNIDSYDKLMSTLYSPEERHKIEWAIGSIVNGDSKRIQKFVVLYGAAGTGKSTVLNIIQQLFDGYYAVFDARSLGSSNNSFALEAFKSNPLVAIQHDGDLSHIEDNTRLNSLVSHEMMTVNEKFKSTYSSRFKSFLFMGTNKPVKITDAKSGLIRRLIDISPTGNKIPRKDYNHLVKQVEFELGGIAWHCQQVYLDNPGAYDDYIPISMLGASNDFYNFVLDSYLIFKNDDGTSLKAAWAMYNQYCTEAKVSYPFSQRIFKEELKNYFREYSERFTMEDGSRIRSYYSGFKTDKFEPVETPVVEKVAEKRTIELNATKSLLDDILKDCPAQEASEKETPKMKWSKVTTMLKDIDTSKVHYVKVPENHIVIDFDIQSEDGSKCLERNLEEAAKWPPTYTELSKSGQGVHLHYIYTGDPSKLSRLYATNVEVKVFTGDSSLRRKVTKCNDIPIATISSGLPLKGDKMVKTDVIKNEKGLRSLIKRNLNKEIHPGTKPSIDFIFKILEEAYESGMNYDVTDMRNAVLVFAANSSHQADYCLKLVSKMHFKSVESAEGDSNYKEDKLIFFDCEVFPNLLLVNWKLQGEQNPVVRMINPSSKDIEELMSFKLIGFNCRRYDNHILYARFLGYNNEQLYKLSQRIVNGDKNNAAFFTEAYNLSYTDIYDFASSGNKKSLKKLEIEMGIHHQELGLPWDQPVPEDKWEMVAEYCDNDVIATEAAFNYLSADWTARQILADVAGMTVNDTTNQLTTRIIFGKNRHPQDEFNYRDLSKPVVWTPDLENRFGSDYEFHIFDKEGQPTYQIYHKGDKLPAGYSVLPFFPGYEYDPKLKRSTYRGEEVGEGGYVYAEPGIYYLVALKDVMSMHPHSVLAEMLFGPTFTKAFREIVYGRVDIKHEAWDAVNNVLDGKLGPYIQKVKDGEMSSKQLANALKTAINSVYGLTAANFSNPFRDERNVDNIVAKRGALFMINLKHEVQKRGFTVAHIKTDSIKIPNATPEILEFVDKYGAEYGYFFEHEATYEKMCLVNDAVYVAKYDRAEECQERYGYVPSDNVKKGGTWTATGTQFQVPYVFKTLFSKEPIQFEDMCETKSVTTSMYLDRNEDLDDVSEFEKELTKLEKDYKQGKISDTIFESTAADLNEKIAKGHHYIFIGKVGLFCPIKPGCNGGVLYRENNGKYAAVVGTSGYRWLEAEMVKQLHKEGDIDDSYYISLVDDAEYAISKYGDASRFISDEYDPTPDFMVIPDDPMSTDYMPFN